MNTYLFPADDVLGNRTVKSEYDFSVMILMTANFLFSGLVGLL